MMSRIVASGQPIARNLGPGVSAALSSRAPQCLSDVCLQGGPPSLAEPSLWFPNQHLMRGLQDSGNALRKRALAQRHPPIKFSGLGRGLARSPMVALAEQVVAHFGPIHQVQSLGVHPEPEVLADVDLAGHLQVRGQSLMPSYAPVGA